MHLGVRLVSSLGPWGLSTSAQKEVSLLGMAPWKVLGIEWEKDLNQKEGGSWNFVKSTDKGSER